MNKRIFSIMVILAIVAAAFFSAGGAQAAPTNLSAEAGIAAYTTIVVAEGVDVLEAVKPAFLMVEYQTDDLVVGTLDLPLYETEYDPLVLVTALGDIVAFYPNTDPAGKLADVISKNLDKTLLEQAVEMVAAAAGVVPTSISHYDFRDLGADKMLLVAEYESDGNAFTLQFVDGNDYYEKSYAFYRTFAPSFTLDNEFIDQVDFVDVSPDYLGLGYYGTIYGHFPVVVSEEEEIDFDPEVLNTFAVEAGDHLGFGALAILFSGDALNTVADADFSKTIPLESPGLGIEGLVIDLTPGDFGKVSPEDGVPEDGDPGVVLNPTLSWGASTAPNYEYCISEIADCDDSTASGWISTGSITSAALSNLLYETTYFWQVRAVNSAGAVEADAVDGVGTWWSFTTADGIAPEAFAKDTTTLSEPIDSLSKVTMTWVESYGAYYYEVCVDTTEACIAPELWHNVGLNTSATIGDLLLDTTYYWQVRAVNDFGITEAGDWEEFNTRRFSKLRPLDGEVYNLTLTFKWEETPLATNGYEYCIDQTDDNACDGDSWIKANGTSVVVGKGKNKLGEGTYYWQVRTFNSDVEANDGEWWSFTVLSKKDQRKLNVFKDSPVNGAVEQPVTDLELSWHATGSFDSYEYCFFDVDDTDTTPIAVDDHCTYTDENWVKVYTAASAIIDPINPDDPLSPTTFYWQVRGNLGDALFYADNGEYWAFTTAP